MIGCKALVNSFDADGAIIVTSDCQIDIPVGTVFTQLRKTRISGDYSGPGEDLGVVANICLELQQVAWFNRSIDVIPAGHSARIIVSGSSLEPVVAALADCEDGEYVILESAGVVVPNWSGAAEPDASADGGRDAGSS